jgi:hypothetical protein
MSRKKAASDSPLMAENISANPEPTPVPLEPTPPLAIAPVSPLSLIQAAIERGMDPDKLGRLMDLQERWEKNRAAEAYAEAIRNFQSRMPIVDKLTPGAKDRSGKLMYKFVAFDDIMEVAQPHLDACGITVTFDTKVAGTVMTTTCHVRVGIHVEDTSISLGLPQIPNANDAQRAGAALSYGQRYSMKAALNIRVKGEDNDAQTIAQKIDAEQVLQIEDLLNATGGDYKKFLQWAGLEAIDQMTVEFFPKALEGIKAVHATKSGKQGK